MADSPVESQLKRRTGKLIWKWAAQELDPDNKPKEMEPQDLAFLEELAGRTEQLWGALSGTISAVEADVARAQAPAESPEAAAPGPRMLPPGVLQVRTAVKV